MIKLRNWKFTLTSRLISTRLSSTPYDTNGRRIVGRRTARAETFFCCMVKSHYRATKFDMVFTLVARERAWAFAYNYFHIYHSGPAMAGATAARRLKIGSLEKNETRNRGLFRAIALPVGKEEEEGTLRLYVPRRRLNASRFPLVRRRRRTKGFDDVWFVERGGIKRARRKETKERTWDCPRVRRKNVIVPGRGTNSHLVWAAWRCLILRAHHRSIDERSRAINDLASSVSRDV